MNIRRSWIKLAMLFLTAAIVGFVIPSTLAYITVQTPSIVNTFSASYFQPEETGVEVRVHKTVRSICEESISPEGFLFSLKHSQSGETCTLTTDANGNASIVLPFSDADLGTTHEYTLCEINDGRASVTYSDRVYTIAINLSVNADNQIVAAASLNGEPVQQITAAFENIYNPGMVLPMTGDTTHIQLYAVLLLVSSACLLILWRRKSDRGRR